ncbi:MAG: hypothetical protein ABL962_21955, partial [Fimbriimonadaceae bacterium]
MSAGFSGWKKEIVQIARRSEASQTMFCQLIRSLFSGDDTVLLCLRYVRSLALTTPIQGKFRPIGLDDFLKKVAWAVALTLHPLPCPTNQLSGVSRGPINLAHHVQTSLSQQRVVVKYDCENAYNTLSRHAIRDLLHVSGSALHKALFNAFYSQPSH